jgi:hypothetical protein
LAATLVAGWAGTKAPRRAVMWAGCSVEKTVELLALLMAASSVVRWAARKAGPRAGPWVVHLAGKLAAVKAAPSAAHWAVPRAD